ncbi:hypothetical protein B9Z19DRAFT_1077944 [Tuber borchii]|uniref:Uncharacterized protein n=1 Tax=Tuber borchii TaxID=42251 RepID=A0A2T7A019_TUBBO|nr:hypothetical protein B9Z19DRAFT_1077944 [Tuber borchii]
MSAQPATQQMSPPDGRMSDTSNSDSKHWESAPTNLFGQLTQLQLTMNQSFGQVNQNITGVNQNIAQINQNITRVNQTITTANANTALHTTQLIQITQQITQNSTDITQMKRDISGILANTTLITQLCSQIVKGVTRYDANTQARIINSHAKSPTDRLRPLRNTENVACERFPSTIAELYALDDETVITLLQQLNLAIGGNASMKRDRLHEHIGILAF